MSDWGSLIEAGASVVAVIISIGAAYAHTHSRLAKLEVKVDTVWDFIIRRAMSEAAVKGVGTVNSPLMLSPEIRVWLEPLKQELQEFYRASGRKMKDRDLFMTVEQIFGERLVKMICIPKQLYAGACVIAATELAKEGTENQDS